MGLFDKIKEMRLNSQKKSWESNGDTLKKIVTTKEQRLEALEALNDAPGEFAVPQLMKRFEIIIDHGMQDRSEKEKVMEILLRHGDISKPYVRAAVQTSKRVSWPIKVAEKLFSHEEYLVLLLECINPSFVSFDETVQERNAELLLALKETPDARVAPRVAPLLKIRDESVRIAALECLESQGAQHEEARAAIKDLATEIAGTENARFLGLVKGILTSHGW